MNNTIKKLIMSENKIFIFMLALFILSLMFSSVVYKIAGDGNINAINFESIKILSINDIFFKIIKRNIIYFFAIIFLTVLGQSKIINILFSLVSAYFGLSVIYLIKTLKFNTLYFALTFTDYIILFPLLFYFTFISNAISKYAKRTKNLEQISKKFDIIMMSYIKLSLIYLLTVIIYSICYSLYIYILSRLLVK